MPTIVSSITSIWCSTDNICVSVQTTLWTRYRPIERIQRYKHGELATNLIQVAIWILPHGEHLNSERLPPPAEWGEDEEKRVQRTSLPIFAPKWWSESCCACAGSYSGPDINFMPWISLSFLRSYFLRFQIVGWFF
jgi:hypothetical protein